MVCCAAYGCSNKAGSKDDKGRPISFHRFPVNEPENLRKWALAARRANWTPTSDSRLCSAHFTEDSFLIAPQAKTRKLNPGAVPTVFQFLENLKTTPRQRKRPAELQTSPTPVVVKVYSESSVPPVDNSHDIYKKPVNISPQMIKNESATPSVSSHNADLNQDNLPSVSMTKNESLAIDNNNDIDKNTDDILPPLSKRQKSVIHDHIACFKSPEVTIAAALRRVTKLRRNVKSLQQQLRRKDAKIKLMKNTIDELKSKTSDSFQISDYLERAFTGLTLEILSNEIKQINVPKNSRRYSDSIKQFALVMHYYSPKAYEYLSSILSIPCSSSLTNWMSAVDCLPGVPPQILAAVNRRIERKLSEAICKVAARSDGE